MKRRLSPIFFLFIVCSPLLSQTNATIDAALRELNQGKVFEAISRLQQIVREKPVPEAYFYLAGLYTRMGRYDDAYRYLEKSNQGKASPDGPYFYQLGVIRRYEGCQPEALAAFQQALKIGMGKEEAAVWRNVGEAQVDLLEWEKAIEAYQNVLRLQPRDAEARAAMGQVYLDHNDPQRAVTELRAALDIAPVPGAHASLGRAYRELGDSVSASAILRQGLAVDPSDQKARYVLAQVLLAAGQTDEGRREMEEYGRLQEGMSRVNNTFETAVSLAQGGELAQAEKLLKESLRLAPRYAPALQILGTVLLNRGDTRQALEVLGRAAAANPLNPETYFNIGTAYLRTSKLAEALAATEQALILDDEDDRFHTQAAEIYSRLKRTAEVQRSRERAAELKARPRNRVRDPYWSEGRRRDDTETVRQICGTPVFP